MWEVGHLEINNLPVIKSAFSLEEPKSSGWLPSLALTPALPSSQGQVPKRDSSHETSQ